MSCLGWNESNTSLRCSCEALQARLVPSGALHTSQLGRVDGGRSADVVQALWNDSVEVVEEQSLALSLSEQQIMTDGQGGICE